MVNKKIFLLLVLVLVGFAKMHAQENRVLVLNDRGRGIKNYTVGNYIHFQFSNQQWITGYIARINVDTIDVKQFTVQAVMGPYGNQILDTLKLGTLSLGINEIIGFAKDKNQYKSVFTDGAFLKAAGIGYILLNITNSLIRKEPVFDTRNLPHLSGGLGAFLLGKIQIGFNPNYRPIGKRYSLSVL